MWELEYTEQALRKSWMNEKNKQKMKDIMIYRYIGFIPVEVIIDFPETRFELEFQEKLNFYNLWLRYKILDNENCKT